MFDRARASDPGIRSYFADEDNNTLSMSAYVVVLACRGYLLLSAHPIWRLAMFMPKLMYNQTRSMCNPEAF